MFRALEWTWNVCNCKCCFCPLNTDDCLLSLKAFLKAFLVYSKFHFIYFVNNKTFLAWKILWKSNGIVTWWSDFDRIISLATVILSEITPLLLEVVDYLVTDYLSTLQIKMMLLLYSWDAPIPLPGCHIEAHVHGDRVSPLFRARHMFPPLV